MFLLVDWALFLGHVDGHVASRAARGLAAAAVMSGKQDTLRPAPNLGLLVMRCQQSCLLWRNIRRHARSFMRAVIIRTRVGVSRSDPAPDRMVSVHGIG